MTGGSTTFGGAAGVACLGLDGVTGFGLAAGVVILGLTGVVTFGLAGVVGLGGWTGGFLGVSFATGVLFVIGVYY